MPTALDERQKATFYYNLKSFRWSSIDAVAAAWIRVTDEVRLHRLTEGSQTKHLVELPLLGVPDEVSRVSILLSAMEHRPPEVRFTQQAKYAQLPVDLHKDNE